MKPIKLFSAILILASLILVNLILASGSVMAQWNSDAAKPGANQAQAEADEAREAGLRKAQQQSRKVIGEAAPPEWPQPTPDPDSRDARPDSTDPGAADADDHGNATSRDMLQRRDQSKAIKQEYKDSGEKHKGKKPWHTSAKGERNSGSDNAGSDDDKAQDDSLDPDQDGDKNKAGKNKAGKKPRPVPTDDQDHN